MKHREFANPLAAGRFGAHVNFAVLSPLAAATGLKTRSQTGNSAALEAISAPRAYKASPDAVGKIMGERDRLPPPTKWGICSKFWGYAIPTCRLTPVQL